MKITSNSDTRARTSDLDERATHRAGNSSSDVPTLLATVPLGASIEVYTDGACMNNPGPAAAAFALTHQGAVVHSSARFLGHGTNNIAELTAALDSLRFLSDRPDLSITLLSDSEQVVKAMPQWVPKWKAKGWRKADGKPVQNRPLYEQLDAIAANFPALRWQHVKGHAGHEFNELVDGLANGAAEAGAAMAVAQSIISRGTFSISR